MIMIKAIGVRSNKKSGIPDFAWLPVDYSTSNRTERSLHCFAWMVVLEPGTGRVGAAKTASFPLPKCVAIVDGAVHAPSLTSIRSLTQKARGRAGARGGGAGPRLGPSLQPRRLQAGDGSAGRWHSWLRRTGLIGSLPFFLRAKGAGAVGILTHGIINRVKYYSHALVLALIPFQHRRGLY